MWHMLLHATGRPTLQHGSQADAKHLASTRVPPALRDRVRAHFHELAETALREVEDDRVTDGAASMQRLRERIEDHETDSLEPVGLRRVFLKRETPPGLWGYLAKTFSLWLLGLASAVWLLFSLVALLTDDGDPGALVLLALLYAVLFLVVWKIPTKKPADFLPEGYLEEYRERKRKNRDN